ncbi:hypothetical protein [Streptomyces albipurpureus]|uniref:Integral membrane protein n=1 Tax=Streptomyces albipurpureus TaxID=2897419 RepID=A0ABT0UM42_9ACTN|nr:hypothetical protein [Streptomyces sp. CWNU-1]MCM2389286.1 hypothetical protein [Streptomyces sp. CWNU-1]
MTHRVVAVVAAIALLLEAIALVAVNGILATVIDGQNMSLDGLDPRAMVMGTWAAGIVLGLYLCGCALVCLLTGLRDQAPSRLPRALLIGAGVVHGVLGAIAAGLVGWGAFASLMAVLGLVVMVLVVYGKREPQTGANPSGPRADGPGAPNGVAPV